MFYRVDLGIVIIPLSVLFKVRLSKRDFYVKLMYTYY